MELIAFASGKGGTGKTLMAACLGFALIKAGQRVLMIDADPATDGLSLFLLGRDGMRQVGGFNDLNTFTGALRQFQKTGTMKCEPRGIHRVGSDEQGDHGISYQAIISGKWIYGDEPAASESLVVPDLDQSTFRKAVAALFASIKAADQYDYVIVDTRGGFAFESTDVCALADSFIVITEPDVTSFYQDRNLVKRISDAAKQLSSRPLLRSIIVNKASEAESKDNSIDLQKLETSFRLELEKEFPVKFLDTHPVPVDIEAFKAYKTQRIPYLAAPASLFAFATLSAYREILQIVTSRWSETQVQQWNALVETVSTAIAARNRTLQTEREQKLEHEKQFVKLQAENLTLQQRAGELSKEMERLENRYERELQRTTDLFTRGPTPPSSASDEIAMEKPSTARVTVPAPKSGGWVGLLFLVALAVAGFAFYWFSWRTSTTSEMLQGAYNESLPISTRVSYLKKLATAGQKDFDGIKLPGANLSGSTLERVSLRSATLRSASFQKANLISCDLSGADLSGADLSDAKMTNCVLRNANLTQADLTHSDLRGADLSGATVLPEQMTGAITNSRTQGVQLPLEPGSVESGVPRENKSRTPGTTRARKPSAVPNSSIEDQQPAPPSKP